MLCFRVPCDVAQLHTSAQLHNYGMMNSVRAVNCFYDTGTGTHQTVAPYSYRRSETVTWSQAQKQH